MAHRLSRGLLESQLEALDLCASLFPQEGELTLTEETERFVPSLREWVEDKSKDGSILGVERDGPRHWENEISFIVQLNLKPRNSDSSTQSYPISITVRLPTVADTRTSDLPPPAVNYLNQASWLPRTSFDELSRSLPQYNSATFTTNSDFVLSIIDYVRDKGPDYIPDPSETSQGDDESATKKGGKSRRKRSGNNENDPEFRVWLWFPSLSTREKRDDIVNWATDYDLTGFVLAGKPAVMCLEGTENNIQDYMADIKSNSWADIPSFQKKVSERYRQPLQSSSTTTTLSSNDPSRRIFSEMSEITKLIPQSGQRGNRGDMAEVREYLEKKGLGEAFGTVIGGGQFSSQ
ncbi:uncharacterized protein JCM6883_004754 [Sporobolomyces salmoneus]|uniref:uncharacterized protein n=1 Tax=Sporobolomyces salmoneus TaxID=183962 RepID=UPI00317C85B8